MSENEVEEVQNTAIEPPMANEGTATVCDWLLRIVALEAWKVDADKEVGPLNMTNREPPTEYAVLLTDSESVTAAFKTDWALQSGVRVRRRSGATCGGCIFRRRVQMHNDMNGVMSVNCVVNTSADRAVAQANISD